MATASSLCTRSLTSAAASSPSSSRPFLLSSVGLRVGAPLRSPSGARHDRSDAAASPTFRCRAAISLGDPKAVNDDHVRCAHALADAAAAVQRRLFRTPMLAVDHKGDDSPVTIAGEL